MSVSIEHSQHVVRVGCRLSPAWQAAVGLVLLTLFWSLSSWTTLEGVRRPDGRVDAEVRTHRLGCRSSPWRVTDLRDVRLETAESQRIRHSTGVRRGSGGDLDTHRVILIDGAGREHPLTRYRTSSVGAHAQAAEEIRRYLADPKLERWVARKPWEPATLWFVGFTLLLVGAAWFGRSTLTLDTAAGTVGITTQGLTGPRRETLPLDDVREFRAVPAKPDKGEDRGLVPEVARRNGPAVRVPRFWFASQEEIVSAVNALERRRQEYELRKARSNDSPAPAAAPSASGTPPGGQSPAKVCVLCGRDCGDAPRVRDALGRYYHQSCHDAGRAASEP